MEVSVIIPVYNAAPYLEEAVNSALAQPETREVIAIDDASVDASLELLKQMATNEPRLIVLNHAGGANQGSAETRNLGIRQAASPYIAFIDADDVMLPGRFALTAKLFEQYPEIDGVYEAVLNWYTDKAVSHAETVGLDSVPDIHMVREKVTPEKLLQQLIDDPIGIIMLQGLCVKRSLFERSGLFDPEFRVFEDMLLVKKMAAVGKLMPGDLQKPVAKRRIHDTNISFSEYKDKNPKAKMEGEVLLKWALDKNLSADKMNVILRFEYQEFIYRNKLDFAKLSSRLKWVKHILAISMGLLRYEEVKKALPVVSRIL